MARESTIVGGGTFNWWWYATWPLISAGVADRGLRVGARFWPILVVGFAGADPRLIELSRADRSALIPWTSIREITLRRSNLLRLTLVDGWRFTFDTIGEPLDGLVEAAQARMAESSRDQRDS